MDNILNSIVAQVDLFILVLVRITALFLIAPFFSQQNISSYIKIGLSVFVSGIIFIAFPNMTLQYENNIFSYFSLVIKEFTVGVLIGFVGYLIFTTFYLAGQMIDFQIGFSMVSIFDPLSQIQVPITGNLYYLLATMILLVTNGHHAILRAIYESYRLIPIGQAKFTSRVLEHIIQMGADAFSIGIKISIPIVVALFILDIALGFLTKVAPQLNVFAVGFILKICLGLLAIVLFLPAFSTITEVVFNEMFRNILKIIQDMAIR